MKPIVHWINSFDMDVPVGNGGTFTVPGNQIHADLKHHENLVRARQSNIEAILKIESEIQKLQQELKNMKDLGESGLSQRVRELSINFVHYIFNSKKTSEYTSKINQIFLEKLSWVTNDPAVLGCLKFFNAKQFNSFTQFGFQENQKIVEFLDRLYALEIDFFSILESIFIDYYHIYPMSNSPSKRKEVEHKLINLIDCYKKSQKNHLAEKKEMIERLQYEVNGLRKKPISNTVDENIVVAQVGFLVEVKSPKNAQVSLQFVHFPIADSEKDIHTIYDHFKEKYNYIGFTTDDKKTKRNTLIDDLLAKQIDSNAKFNKQLDYHSERDFYLSMQDSTQNIVLVKNLERKLGKDVLFKVRGVFIDLHSSRYMCDRCQEATLSMQDPKGPFLSYLSANLKKTFGGEVLPDAPLQLVTRVSAEIEFKIPKKNAVSHLAYEKKLLALNAIFSMDTTTMNIPKQVELPKRNSFKEGLHYYSLYTSSENKDQTKSLTLAYNDVMKPIRNEAATKIQFAYRQYKISKDLKNLSLKEKPEKPLKLVIQKMN